MLTPILEKLVLSGNATYNTFVVGGTQKHILNVPDNRFIIITSIIYQSGLNSNTFQYNRTQLNTYLENNSNTQLKVLSNKSVNNFVFRNSLNLSVITSDDFLVFPSGSTKVDTYLVHESDVSFSFCRGGNISVENNDDTPARSIAFNPPFDWGKEGQAASIKVNRIISTARPSETPKKYFVAPVGNIEPSIFQSGGQNDLQFSYPYSAGAYISSNHAFGFPLAHVEYVEIQGNPTNLSATL